LWSESGKFKLKFFYSCSKRKGGRNKMESVEEIETGGA
jgi:hypothetical protein